MDQPCSQTEPKSNAKMEFTDLIDNPVKHSQKSSKPWRNRLVIAPPVITQKLWDK
jgi:hypothetical protein